MAERLLEQFKRETSADDPREIQVKTDFEDELKLLSRKVKSPLSGLSMVVAVTQVGVAPKNFRSDGVLVQDAKPVEILGIGENSLVRFLTDTLYRPELNLRHGTALAALTLQAAKTYCPQYCNGETDISCAPKGKEYCYDVSKEEIIDMEDIMKLSVRNRLDEALQQATDFLK